MTGIEFDVIFQRKINQAYSDFYDSAKRTSLYAEALVTGIERQYKQLDEQREYDYLNSIVSTYQVFTLTNSAIDLADVTDYNHLLTCRPLCKDLKWNATIKKYDTTVVPTTVMFNKKTALRSGEVLNIIDVNALTRTETQTYAKQISTYMYELYLDADFQTEADVQYVNPEIERYVRYWAKPYFSDRKINMLGEPSIYRPKVEVADSKLKVYPYSTKIWLDYLKTTPIAIVSNGADDLSPYYPDKFLYFIADVAAEIFFREVRDANYNIQKVEVMTDLAGN